MRKIIALLCVSFCMGSIAAQCPEESETACCQNTERPAKNWLTAASLEFRADWQGTWRGGEQVDEASGFRGQFLNLKLAGNIGKQWNWAYRQRFSKDMFKAGGYLNATDFLYLQYHPTERWTITGGKQFVAVGGFEYDYAPIDVYKYSRFCDMVNCYGFGLSAAYDLTPHDNLLVQAAQSIFLGGALNRYSYNVKWTGQHGIYQSLYSIGMHEYDRGKYINVIALGNRFDLGRCQIVADFTNRYASVGDAKFLSDMTAVAQVWAQPIRELNLYAHYSYDRNDGNYADTLVEDGTDLHTVGLGAEYFPLRGSKDIRVHAAYYHSSGKENFVSVGLTFRPNLLNIKAPFHKK